jgi:two-component system KDP operon response regulator KdpE
LDKKRILIVDDEPRILNFVKVQLQLELYEVLTANNGEQALAIAGTDKPDMVLLDVLMVPMGGLEVLEKLREFSQVPVLIFSRNHRVVEEAMKMGANDYIAKPLNPDALLKKIKTLLPD